jgi:hypothetical protein
LPKEQYVEEALTFLTTFLEGGGGITGSSSDDKGTISFVDAILSELIFAFFEGGRFVSPSELIKRH